MVSAALRFSIADAVSSLMSEFVRLCGNFMFAVFKLLFASAGAFSWIAPNKDCFDVVICPMFDF